MSGAFDDISDYVRFKPFISSFYVSSFPCSSGQSAVKWLTRILFTLNHNGRWIFVSTKNNGGSQWQFRAQTSPDPYSIGKARFLCSYYGEHDDLLTWDIKGSEWHSDNNIIQAETGWKLDLILGAFSVLAISVKIAPLKLRDNIERLNSLSTKIMVSNRTLTGRFRPANKHYDLSLWVRNYNAINPTYQHCIQFDAILWGFHDEGNSIEIPV